MTHLWIHDSGRRGHVINGVKRRGFIEATPYRVDDYQVVPQMCSNCCKTRERITEIRPWSERRSLADQIVSDRKRRKRRRKTKTKQADVMIADLGDLL